MRQAITCILILSFSGLMGFSSVKTKPFQWTRFRGADGRGIDASGNVPVAWDSVDFQWNLPLPGVGNASPVVWGNSIFVTSGDDEKDRGYLFSIDDQSGKVLWQKEFIVTDLALHKHNKLAAATPAVDESQVYVIWHSKEKTELSAFSHEGNLQWQSQFEGIESRHGGGSSLMLTGDLVVFTREQEKEYSTLTSSWVAVDKKTGEIVWELERESPENNSFATPLLVQAGQHPAQLIFGSQSHGITSVNPETGQVLWERKEIIPARVVASPFLAQDQIIMCCNGEGLAIRLDPETNRLADTATFILPHALSPYVPTPIAVGDLLFLFMDSGTVACVKLHTGELLWKERPAGPIYGSPICVGGLLYCMTQEGEVLVIEASAAYSLKGINVLGDGSFSTPVMSSTGMVFRTFNRLIKL